MKPPPVRILNVIVSSKVDSGLDIELLANKLHQAVYDPEVFPGLIYRRQKPKATIIMFSTGKITSVGSRSERAARHSLNLMARYIRRLTRKNVALSKISTENVVAMSDVGCAVDVEKAVERKIKGTYDPEQFPGFICRLKNSVTVLIFSSGKIICVGSKSEYEAKSSIHHMYSTLADLECL